MKWQRSKPSQRTRVNPVSPQPQPTGMGGDQNPQPLAPGCIRLGVERDSWRIIDLDLRELAEHIFLPGASGSGKTTTLTRLADGVLALGQGVAMVDCKGSDAVKARMRALARKHGVPFYVVDPSDGESLRYDPCVGDGADVSNKLIGVFAFSDAADVYKRVAQRVLPVLVNALRAANRPVTLEALAEALSSSNVLRRYGRDATNATGDTKWADRIDAIGRQDSGVIADGHLGLSVRLEALCHGKFGPILGPATEDQPALDWDVVLSNLSVTYVALRATASSEDVNLMGRVIAQDLKQAAARRLEGPTGAAPRPQTPTLTLLIIDEFAALREAEQFLDLLLQAREALMPTVISTQFIPKSDGLREAALGAGLILAHRLTNEDAKVMAEQFGTRKTFKTTAQYGEEGPTGLGSGREVDEFHIHPNELRDMPRGHVALRSLHGRRRCVARIYRPEE